MSKPPKSNSGSHGKLLDTWYYEYKGLVESDNPDEEDDPIQTVQGQKVAVELRLIKEFESGTQPPQATKQVHFLLRCKEADIKLKGNDVESLRKAMWGKLDTRYEVKWEEYLLVEIQPHSPWEGIGTGFTFGHQRVERGTAWDGTLLMRSFARDRHATRKIEPWPGEFRNKQGRVLACIPATDGTRDDIKAFGDQVDALREKLADLLRPGMIQKTFANLGNLRMLPSGVPDEEACPHDSSEK